MNFSRIASRIAATEDEITLLSKQDVINLVSRTLEVEPASIEFKTFEFTVHGGSYGGPTSIGARGGGEVDGRDFYFSIQGHVWADKEGVKYDPNPDNNPMEIMWED